MGGPTIATAATLFEVAKNQRTRLGEDPHMGRRCKSCSVIAVAVAALVMGTGVAVTIAGTSDLVKSFGGDGRVTISIASGRGAAGTDTVHSALHTRQGRLVFGGATASARNGSPIGFVAMLNGDGTRDRRFGRRGIVKVVAPGADNFQVDAITEQRNGRIVGVGTAFEETDGGGRSWVLAFRLTRTGALDRSFGRRGRIRLRASRVWRATAARAVLSSADGKTIVLVDGYTTAGATARTALLRLGRDGSLDTAFSDDGVAAITSSDPAAATFGNALVCSRSGHLLVAGQAGEARAASAALFRFGADGRKDATFGDRGEVRFRPRVDVDGAESAAHGVVQLRSGRTVVVGRFSGAAGTNAAIAGTFFAAFNDDGRPDAGFGESGQVVRPMIGSERVAILASTVHGVVAEGLADFFLVAGMVGGRFALARFGADGRADPSFARLGLARPFRRSGAATTVLRFGKSTVIGAGSVDRANGSSDLALARYR